MPSPARKIDEYRDYIVKEYRQRVARSTIRRGLKVNFDFDVSLGTLSRWIHQWGLEKQQERTVVTPELVVKIEDLFFRVGLTEKQLLAVLRRDGFPVTKRGLQRIRLENGWTRRPNDPAERFARTQKISEAFSALTEQSVALLGHGQATLPSFFHTPSDTVQRSWDELFDVKRVMFPDAIKVQKKAMCREKG